MAIAYCCYNLTELKQMLLFHKIQPPNYFTNSTYFHFIFLAFIKTSWIIKEYESTHYQLLDLV